MESLLVVESSSIKRMVVTLREVETSLVVKHGDLWDLWDLYRIHLKIRFRSIYLSQEISQPIHTSDTFGHITILSLKLMKDMHSEFIRVRILC